MPSVFFFFFLLKLLGLSANVARAPRRKRRTTTHENNGEKTIQKKYRRTLAVDNPVPDTAGKDHSGPRKPTSRLKLLDFQKKRLSKQRIFTRIFRYRLYTFVRMYVLRTAYSAVRFKFLFR